MSQDDPGRRASRRLFETAYTRSPYRFTVIGYPDIFNELKREDILAATTASKYAPNNIFFVVVGDVKPAEVVAQIRDGLRRAPKPRPLPPVVLPDGTAPDRAARNHRGSAHRAGPLPLRLAHPGPAASGRAGARRAGRAAGQRAQFAALPGRCARSWAWSTPWTPGPTVPGNPGLFGMSAVVDAEKFDAARDAMLAEVERMQADAGLRRGTEQGGQAIHLRHALPRARPCKARPRTSAAAGWPPTT